MKRDKQGRFAKAGDNASPACEHEHMMVAYMTGVAQGKDIVRAETVKSFPLHVLTDELRRRGMKVFDAEGAHVKPTLEQIRADGWTDEEIDRASFKNQRENIDRIKHMVRNSAPCVPLDVQAYIIDMLNELELKPRGRKHARCAR